MISVIIPALNEAELLPETLNCIRANNATCEVLVVDGGSGDETAQLAEAGGARVIHSPKRQRALQMNLGAQQARGDIFLFLHADTWIGPNALQQIERTLHQPGLVGGGFARRFPERDRCQKCQKDNMGWSGWEKFGNLTTYENEHTEQ